MSVVEVALAGLLCGLHAATWGAFKDTPFEGFTARSFLRSPVLAMLVAVALAFATDIDGTGVLLFVGVVYAGERLATEWWKGILREDDQAGYTIPMRLAVHGRPIDDRVRRYGLGAAVVAGLVGACWAFSALQAALPPGPIWLAVLVAGTGGWLTAVGGAWKDAPIEGFSGWKFLRSPCVATVWGLVLSRFTGDWVLLAVAAGGWSVISIETYKTFLTGNRPPGKFDGQPVRFRVDQVRAACRTAHVGVYVVLAVGLGSRLLTPPRGSATSQATVVLTVSLAAAMAGGLVLAQRAVGLPTPAPNPAPNPAPDPRPVR